MDYESSDGILNVKTPEEIKKEYEELLEELKKLKKADVFPYYQNAEDLVDLIHKYRKFIKDNNITGLDTTIPETEIDGKAEQTINGIAEAIVDSPGQGQLDIKRIKTKLREKWSEINEAPAVNLGKLLGIDDAHLFIRDDFVFLMSETYGNQVIYATEYGLNRNYAYFYDNPDVKERANDQSTWEYSLKRALDRYAMGEIDIEPILNRIVDTLIEISEREKENNGTQNRNPNFQIEKESINELKEDIRTQLKSKWSEIKGKSGTVGIGEILDDKLINQLMIIPDFIQLFVDNDVVFLASRLYGDKVINATRRALSNSYLNQNDSSISVKQKEVHNDIADAIIELTLYDGTPENDSETKKYTEDDDIREFKSRITAKIESWLDERTNTYMTGLRTLLGEELADELGINTDDAYLFIDDNVAFITNGEDKTKLIKIDLWENRLRRELEKHRDSLEDYYEKLDEYEKEYADFLRVYKILYKKIGDYYKEGGLSLSSLKKYLGAKGSDTEQEKEVGPEKPKKPEILDDGYYYTYTGRKSTDAAIYGNVHPIRK